MQENIVLRNRIESALRQQPSIGSRIEIEVVGRHVRLTGIVETLQQKLIAEDLANSCGPIELESDIIIAPREFDSDKDVLEIVEQALGGKPDAPYSIGAERVIEGVVYLRGTAKSVAAVNDAVDLVSQAQGVKDIVVDVAIAPSRPIDDIGLRDNVLDVLHHDPDVHTERIDVQADDGTILMQGTVHSMLEKTRASTLAKHVTGVKRVVNDLRTQTMPASYDAAVEQQVLQALESASLDLRDIRVNVLDGVVFLDGTIPTYKQKDRAQRLAEAVMSVRFVQNDLVIGVHIEPKAG